LSKTAIVTGAGSGLGRALAVRLARDGWQIAIADIAPEGAAETLELVEQAGGSGRVERLDVTQPDEWEQLRDRLQADWDHLDLLCNNAGVCAAGRVGRYTLENWRWMLEVNLFGVVHGCHTMLDWLGGNPRGGQIMNVASIAGLIGFPESAAYCAAKFGVVGLSESLAAELADSPVSVTIVCPGFFASRLFDSGRYDTKEQRALAKVYVDRSEITAEQVADVAVRAMQRNELYAIVGTKAKRWARLKRWIPSLFRRRLAKEYNREVERLASLPEEATPAMTDEAALVNRR